jgi:aminoglycoside phosphotransferase (APT) family kinase protein
MVSSGAERMPWAGVPAGLRAAIAEVLGSPVVEAASQPGGFSPGSADRVLTASGRRAFVKTANSELNARSVEIHRLEAAMAAGLPASAHAPELLGVVDHGDWVALVLEDVEGRHPDLPWRPGETVAVLDALADLAHDPIEDGFAGPTLADATSDLFEGWRRLIDDPTRAVPLGGDLGEWVAARLASLADASEAAIGDLVGDRLVHRDVRADNILIRPNGSVVLVDWPWATRGAGWFDALSLLVNVRLYDPAADVDRRIAEHPVFHEMDPDAATRVIAGLAGFFIEASMREPIPALPTLRRFQLDQGVAALQWLRVRMDGRTAAPMPLE